MTASFTRRLAAFFVPTPSGAFPHGLQQKIVTKRLQNISDDAFSKRLHRL
jgi:hypothetical protein